MIHDAYIRRHHLAAPWSRWSLVEQDLIICRAVIAIFSDEFLRNELAWRGGTALHKLYLNDMQGILRPGTEFDPRSAYNRIRETFFALPSWAGIAAPHIHLHANGPHSMSYIRTILSKKRNSERRE